MNKKTLWTLFIIVLAGTLVAESWMHPHVTFGIEGLPYFNAVYGFLACAFIVVLSKFLGFFLKRKEDYYKEKNQDDS